MGGSKELWFAMMEERCAELLDTGMDEQEAYEAASNQAHHDLADRMADMADHYRDIEKDRML